MRSGRAPAVAGRPSAVTWCHIAGLRDRQLVVHVSAQRPRSPWVIIVREVDSAIVPRVSVSVEAASRLNRDEGRLGDVARTLEKVVAGRVRAVLSAI